MTKNNTKKALLASAISTLLCVTMLVGSTFAWFTDEAATTGNTIKAGTLDVDIVDAEGNSLETLNWVDKDGEAMNQDDILWEPNATYNLQGFKVKNNGSLALKYKLVLDGITATDKNGATITADTLKDVITFKMGEEEVTLSDGLEVAGVLAAGETTENAITISVHMNESAGNEYQGMSIENFGIKVEAGQAVSEEDSISDQYDVDAPYVQE